MGERAFTRREEERGRKCWVMVGELAPPSRVDSSALYLCVRNVQLRRGNESD